ncbi:cytochrome c oxidase assembly factor CtaG, partial [Bacillus velezensis]
SMAVIFFQGVRTDREKDTLAEPPYIEHTVS